MSGAMAGSGWWDGPDDDGPDGDGPDGSEADPPLDNRTTQPMAPIEPSGAAAESRPNPSSGSADTVRVEAPAWFLHAQQRAAKTSLAAEAAESGDDTPIESEGDADADDEAPTDQGGVANDAPVSVVSNTAADADDEAAPITPIDPTAVCHEFDVVPPAEAASAQARTSRRAGESPPQFLDPSVAASYREPTRPPDVAGGSLGLGGATLLVVGSFLTWGRSTGAVEASVNGLDGSNGWGTLTCGMVVAFAAALVLFGRRSGLVGGAMLVSALAAVYFCGFSAVDILRTGDDLPEILARSGIDQGAAENTTLGLAAGFGVVVAGAVASLIAGAIAFARRA